MKILITGITGRVGANLAARLVAEGHTVHGLVWDKDQRTEKLQHLGIHLHSGNLTEVGDVEAAIKNMEAVYHLGAAFQGGGPFTEDQYYNINVGGTFNVLEGARRAGVGQVIYASTDALLSKYPPGGMTDPISEDLKKTPGGGYAITKSIGEDLCLSYWQNQEIPVTITRFAMIFGAGEILRFPQFYYNGSAPDNRVESTVKKLAVLRDKTGRSYKKHTADVRDIVGGLVAALGKEKAFGEVVQLAGPEPFTWEKVVPYLADALNLPYGEIIKEGNPTFYEFNLEKARNLIDFIPAYDIFRTIDDAIRYERGEDIGLLPT